MNKELFGSMQEQMKPSPEGRAALSEKLAQPVKKRPAPWVKYGAAAACAALVIGTFSVYHLYQDQTKWMLITRNFHRDVVVQNLHSYVTTDEAVRYVTENAETGTDTGGGGDRDMDMSSEELAQAMLEAGYTQDEIDEYQSIGYQMTWAKWWKFYHLIHDTGEAFTLDGLKDFSWQELYVTTGDLPGGAYVGDVPAQEEAQEAYQKLMDHFDGDYPDWYGGAYLDSTGYLTVLLVESEDPGDKSLELQVLDWTDSGHVIFASAKYSLVHLNGLMEELNKLPETDPKCGDVMAVWGTDEEANRVELTLTQVNDHILSVLAKLDPEDDAIYVKVGQRPSVDVGRNTEEPVSHDVIPGGAVVPEGKEPVAIEPWLDPSGDPDGAHYAAEDRGMVQDLPERKQPAVVEPAPEEDNTLSFDPSQH